mgnify:FL=1
MSKRFSKFQIGSYEVEVQDYQYKRRAPVSVRVSGTILGECHNGFGEPCYFYQCADAMTIPEGIETAKRIVAERPT